ncbi:unnamed protein product [Parascedosporium putredinis]|uniref:Glucose-methanol-choline oxidoreductase N-terminal domain-containing protein n=1 Tax=Parascedosporium putredinis TaxID=1442378 RepID=A0A9P1HB78_9PEZI|nr:unnamed protein product [Parascedosporium putredinis]CAI8004700.1 unnamed protein product [Parascedosporium putredinis]
MAPQRGPTLGRALVALLSLSGAYARSAKCQPRAVGDPQLLNPDEVEDEYDYIIVGGGTAGLTVADRLTESGEYTVLVIEWGPTITAPRSGPLPAAQTNLNNRTTAVIGGLMLGGSSGVNGLQAWRFHPPNEDTAEALDIKYDESYWGNTSDVHASFPTFNWPGLRLEMEAFSEIEGVEFPPDSGAGSPGVYWYPTSADPSTMTRSFSRTGHFDGIARENYNVLTDHRVLNVLFDEDSASGVRYVAKGAKNDTDARSVSARKEVILAAGTIHTPQILQGSGIGAEALLESAGIELKVDLPGVGWNFQDHPLGGVLPLTKRKPLDSDGLSCRIRRVSLRTPDHRLRKRRLLPPLPVIAPEAFEDIASRFEAQDPAAYLPADSPEPIGALVYLHPASRGTVYVNPENPYFAEPVVDYRAMSNPADVDIEVEFVKFTRRYWTETSLSEYGPVETRPGEDVREDEDLRAYVRANVSPSTFHPVGTSAMLPRELGGVVDQALLVYGVSKLSVVDASVMPDLPGAYTQQSAFAVAEKAADLIKARA